jgi:hypothetical protein
MSYSLCQPKKGVGPHSHQAKKINPPKRKKQIVKNPIDSLSLIFPLLAAVYIINDLIVFDWWDL